MGTDYWSFRDTLTADGSSRFNPKVWRSILDLLTSIDTDVGRFPLFQVSIKGMVKNKIFLIAIARSPLKCAKVLQL